MLAKIGVFLTLAFFCFWAGLVYSRFSDFAALSLNELGDFLSGTVGSVALLWLVLGYFQQGKELKNSNEALLMQAAELKNSVEQQKELVEVSREAIELEKQRVKHLEEQRSLDLDPVLTPDFGLSAYQDGTSTAYQYKLAARGRTIRDVLITFRIGDHIIHLERIDMLVDGWTAGSSSRIKYLEGELIVGSLFCNVEYRREDGSIGLQAFEFLVPDPNEVGSGVFSFKRFA